MRFLSSAQVAKGLALFCLGFSQSLQADDPALNATTVTIDFSKKIATTQTGSFGLNAFASFDPTVSGDARYEANLTYMNPGILRLHSYNMMGNSKVPGGGWLDDANKQWDRAKIKDVLSKLSPTATLLINIPTWPEWLSVDGDGCLLPSDQKAFADFCADLVRIVNLEDNRHVLYWEITNEKDDVYWGSEMNHGKQPRVDDLVQIYLQCAAAMKAVDPTIKTGGPAAARPDHQDQVHEFIKGARDQLDFVSFHQYASGSADDSDISIFTRAMDFGKTAAQFKDMVHQEIPDRIVPIVGDEFNISWTWETQDPRMGNYKGAVFDSLALTSLVLDGANWTCAWNDCDGVYGKMRSGDYQLRPSADLYHLLNTYFLGDVVDSSSTNPTVIVPLAVANGNHLAFSLTSSRSTPQDSVIHLLPDNFNVPNTPVTLYQIDGQGLHLSATTLGAVCTYHFPSSSVMLVTWDKAP